MSQPYAYLPTPVSTPPKGSIKNVQCDFGNGTIRDCSYDHKRNLWFNNFDGFKVAPISWLRPVTVEEYQMEMAEFAEWCINNGWTIWQYNRNDEAVWTDPTGEAIRTTSELLVLFTEWKSKGGENGIANK